MPLSPQKGTLAGTALLAAWLLACPPGATLAGTRTEGTSSPPAARTTRVFELPRQVRLPETHDGILRTLDYQVLQGRDVITHPGPGPDPTLKQQFEVLDLPKTRHDYEKTKWPDPKPGLDTSHWVPSWVGTSGGLDIPWGYVTPPRQLVVGLTAKNRWADGQYWPQVYRHIDGSDRGVVLNYGLLKGVEITASADNWDRNFVYAPQIDLNNPAAAPTSAQFSGDRTFAGGGAKGAFATEDFHVAAGIYSTAFRNLDRNIIEFRDYDRLNSVYIVGSTRPGKSWAGHILGRYSTYDWGGSVFPSGATTGSDPTGGGGTSANGLFVDPNGVARQGFAPARQRRGTLVFRRADGTLTQDPTDTTIVDTAGKGTNHWFGLGLGVDFSPSKNFLVLLEVNWEAAIDFIGVDDWFVNLGARYQRANWAATFGMRHLESRGYREPVLSAAYRF